MSENLIFDKLKSGLLSLDPVTFAENYLTLDGKKFRLNGNGYKPFSDIYRYIGIKALEEGSKPIILVKSRQVGATTMACALEMYFSGCGLFGTGERPPMRIFHIWPQLEYTFDYTKSKLNPMIASSISMEEKKGQKTKSFMQNLMNSNTSTNDSLQFKEFVNGNQIWIESAGIDGDRLRGKTGDAIFFDEVQDIPFIAISNSLKILNKSKYGPKGDGVQVYFGTPKNRNSNYFDLWTRSSQQYFYLGCEKCKKHFPLYTPGSDEWEKIWIKDFIVKCTHCDHEQDKLPAQERGKWVALKEESSSSLVGFHINQLYMPEFSKEKILAQKPGVHIANSERTYQNEVLGEFYQGDIGIMSPDEIRNICGDPERKFMAGLTPADDTLAFLGIDIGAKSDFEQQISDKRVASAQGQSYSTAVVLIPEGSHKLFIARALKFKRNDLQSKKEIVEQLMRQYNVKLAICDIGFANDFNEIMQTQFGGRFLSSMAAGRLNNHIKYNDEVYPKIINFERDYYIAELYEQMKKGHIRFPLGSYEQIAWLIQHCTSMEIKPSISRSGDMTPHYVKGNSPNDGAMALLNAYIAYKFHMSGGFKKIGPTTNQNVVRERPPVVGAFIPRMP